MNSQDLNIDNHMNKDISNGHNNGISSFDQKNQSFKIDQKKKNTINYNQNSNAYNTYINKDKISSSSTNERWEKDFHQ